MIVTRCQRWRDRRDSYRPAGEPFNTSRHEVAAIETDAVAKDFVVRHHYAASFPAARYRYGLYDGMGQLVGVAVFSVPCRNDVLTSVFPGDPMESVELGRLVLLDHVRSNAESWLVARCFELLRREGIGGVVSFSDPMPRIADDGTIVKPGHCGTCYQASNAVYLGRATARSLRLLPDGRVFSDRAMSKIRARHQGWRYAAAVLEKFGAPRLKDWEDSKMWLRAWLPMTTKLIRHPGNFKYAFGLDKTRKRMLPASLPYPKLIDAPPDADREAA